MNAPQQRVKEVATQLERATAERAKAREPEGIAPILAEMRIGGPSENREALQALMKNALASPSESPLEPEVTVKVVGLSGELAKDGCDFVKMAYLFLAILKCPAYVRDFVLAVCALSGGDAENFKPMPDVQIAELIGYDRKYIKQKREELIAWQTKSTFALVDIQENSYDPVNKRYLPTEYRARVVPVIAQFIRRARSVRTASQNFAQKNVIERGYHEIVDELSSELPVAPLVHRREPPKTFAKPKDQQLTLMHGQQSQLVAGIKRHLLRVMDMKHNPREVWQEIMKEVEAELHYMTRNRPEYRE